MNNTKKMSQMNFEETQENVEIKVRMDIFIGKVYLITI